MSPVRSLALLVHAKEARSWLARAGTALLAIVILRLAFEMWWVSRLHEHLWTQVGTSLLYLAGATFLFLAAAGIRHERLDKAGFIVLCAALAFYAAVQVNVMALHYTSDALLFVHQSSFLTLSGLNPYQHTLVAGYEAFQVPYYVQTPTTSGGLVTNLNYPALSFLVYTPFVALGLDDLRPVSIAFLLATVGLVYLAAPRHMRLLCMSLLFLSSFFLSFAISGFDIVYVFFLLVTVVAWRHNLALAMVAFGLSAATKQPVWFIGPFLLIRLFRDAPQDDVVERTWSAVKHLSYAIAAFLLPNAVFIAWDPLAWIQGVLTPLGASGDDLVPLSQGLTIVFYTGTLYAPHYLLTVLSFSLLVFLVFLYGRSYDRLKEALWVAPALILLVNERTLQNYFEMFYPVLLCLMVATTPSLWLDDEDDPPPPAVQAVARVAVVPASAAAPSEAAGGAGASTP